AYFRTYFNRHFKEPCSCVSDSMTEDAAVFGGQKNMFDGLPNAKALYQPEMIAVSTTCMAEVIGDDLNSFIQQAKEKGSVEATFDVPYAHTPAFVGSHVDGYDNMQKGILSHFWDKAERVEGDSINIVPGFDGFAVGNNREIKRMLDEMGVTYTFLSDVSDVYDTPSDGQFRMYAGGTKLEDAKAALNAKATVSLQEWCTPKTMEYIEEKGQQTAALHYPMGVQATDEFLMKVSDLTGKAIPDSLKLERGRLVDAMADSQAHLHGKRYALYGDPDQLIGYTQFLLELGAEPAHVLATNGGEEWAKKVQASFDASPYGAGCKVYPKRDLWHMRSLLFTEPVDFLIGNTYGKYLERDTGTPLVRMVFPIFDRHHYHRFPTWGYEGGMRVLVNLLDEFFETLDANTIVPGKTDYSYDIIR
ncbi:MAG: nitrogenase molybdenum-iron protein subunit beta, partial [Hydrogenophaga sp.]|nr:nitrogenase molybdenum-iron protein subunit beta [Hydrogenophaga sp.]